MVSTGEGLPSPDRLLGMLSEVVGGASPVEHLEVLPSVTSTNDVAMADGRVGLVVLAVEQTQGRGRHGSSWLSPPGGLYLSYVPDPDASPGGAGALPVLAGLSVARAVEGYLGGGQARLKWPNDVLLGGRKVAGVLVEARAAGSRGVGPGRAVAGVGVNANAPVGLDPAEHPDAIPPISLGELAGGPVDLGRLAAILVAELARSVQRGLAREDMEEYRERSDTVGRRVSFLQGSRRLEGLAVDVSMEGGGLVVETGEGRRMVVTSGEVRHLRVVP